MSQVRFLAAVARLTRAPQEDFDDNSMTLTAGRGGHGDDAVL